MKLTSLWTLVLLTGLVFYMGACSSNYSLPPVNPVNAVSTPTATANFTATNTPTTTNTVVVIATSTPSSTPTNTVPGTATFTNTATNTITLSPTITLSFTPTHSPTITNTPTIAATATPSPNFDYASFDSSPWVGTTGVPYIPPSPYTAASIVGTNGSTVAYDVNTDPQSGAGGISAPYGLEYHGNFVTGDQILMDVEYGPSPGTGANVTPAIWVPDNLTLSVMVYASQTTTLENAYLLDNRGDNIEFRGLDQVVVPGVWTNVTVGIGVNVTATTVGGGWTSLSGTGFLFTNVVEVGFEFTTAPGAYDFFLDNVYFLSQ